MFGDRILSRFSARGTSLHLAVALGLFGGCEPSGVDGTTGDAADSTAVSEPDPVTQSSCQRHAEYWCGRYSECVPSFLLSFSTGVEECVELNLGWCLDRIESADSLSSAATIDACVFADAALQSCEAWWNSYAPECELVPGERLADESCLWDDECQSASCSFAANTDQCGSCAPMVGLGELCPGSTQCSNGLWCTPDTQGDYRCSERAEFGEPCDAATRLCVPSLRCADGACRGYPQNGEACESGRCSDWNSCDTPTQVCVPTWLASVGDACGSTDGNWVDCGADAWCVRGECRAVPQLGEACNDSGIPACAHGHCMDGICQPEDHAWCLPTRGSARR